VALALPGFPGASEGPEGRREVSDSRGTSRSRPRVSNHRSPGDPPGPAGPPRSGASGSLGQPRASPDSQASGLSRAPSGLLGSPGPPRAPPALPAFTRASSASPPLGHSRGPRALPGLPNLSRGNPRRPSNFLGPSVPGHPKAHRSLPGSSASPPLPRASSDAPEPTRTSPLSSRLSPEPFGPARCFPGVLGPRRPPEASWASGSPEVRASSFYAGLPGHPGAPKISGSSRDARPPPRKLHALPCLPRNLSGASRQPAPSRNQPVCPELRRDSPGRPPGRPPLPPDLGESPGISQSQLRSPPAFAGIPRTLGTPRASPRLPGISRDPAGLPGPPRPSKKPGNKNSNDVG
jgi:hypothetical protein